MEINAAPLQDAKALKRNIRNTSFVLIIWGLLPVLYFQGGISRYFTTAGFHDERLVAQEERTFQPIVPPDTSHKKVLVTGGAGFIGSHVAEALLERGDDVVIVDEMNFHYDVRLKESNLDSLRAKFPDPTRLSIYKGDICDEHFMEKIFDKEQPKWVCHLAARAGVRPSIQDPYKYIHSNVEGTTRLLDLSRKAGILNFVYASSSSVYGESDSTLFSETEITDQPVSPYAATKKSTELIAFTFHHLYKLNVSGLRFFTVYGPRGRPDMAPFKFIDRVSKMLTIDQFGDGNTFRDYTYISDIVDGIVRSIDRPYGYEIFNLGKGNSTSLKYFIDLIQKEVGVPAKINLLPAQPGDVPYTSADIRNAKHLLGYEPKVPIDEGIKRMAAWYASLVKGGDKICFIKAVFGNSSGEIMAPPPVTDSTLFSFYAFTDSDDLQSNGWEKVTISNITDKDDIINSRYPKFMSWRMPEIRENCKTVFYADAMYLPHAKDAIWEELSMKIRTSEVGLMQYLLSDTSDPMKDLDTIASEGKDTIEHVQAEKEWLLKQPNYKDDITMYASSILGYDPSNPRFQEAATMFWDRYSLGEGSNQDQPFWSFVLHNLGLKPLVMGSSFPLEDDKYWKLV